MEILEGGRAWCGWPVGFMGLAVHGVVRVAEQSRGRSRLEDEERKVGGDAAMVGPNGQRLKVRGRQEWSGRLTGGPGWSARRGGSGRRVVCGRESD